MTKPDGLIFNYKSYNFLFLFTKEILVGRNLNVSTNTILSEDNSSMIIIESRFYRHSKLYLPKDYRTRYNLEI